MHIHILGICGTFMGGIAILARQLGHKVTGSDANVYPPMSTQLEEQGITLMEGYEPQHLAPRPDCVVIGNALSRGNPAVEHILNNDIPYTSGPQWLSEHVLASRWVLGVAGTHGKSTTASMLAWMLEANKLEPGFLIGGVPANFGVSSRLGQLPFFVVEADEYDTAFFDKRSKFVHYRPRTLIMNNLEYDHADIFPDLGAIQDQFHHLVRTVPGNGLLIVNQHSPALHEVLARGSWTPHEYINHAGGWSAQLLEEDGSVFEVSFEGVCQGRVNWSLFGQHNVENALAAIAAARHAGVPAGLAIESLSDFRNIKRRMEIRGKINGVTVYDDFAHHPTAIASTLNGLRRRVGTAPIIAVLEPRSNTMRMGVQRDALPAALSQADRVIILQPDGLSWDIAAIFEESDPPVTLAGSTEAILEHILQQIDNDTHVLIMSNGGFDNLHARLLERLQQKIGKNNYQGT
ncbi:UDP-N-acetylmuramate:L-alanyl-gamma-D-glutamyl-meso-diaminopimelate ligase [Thiohalophilus thiocyanatoxydans]|uniref:UDP-N-acetylmuramate--L-alanyl-gamma-D-glutamyl-meso-2,6-diaminoheptandioate ligase n=1 Tax=Thiohalophilus thiocyanatoxydans TaxID=381308 RepID=A0A4R8IMZ0_9GAMM|nr:UDP-N-acetylmuramate:L-alanyl-gamma-D-glutamyl-meso-diaminopimelate ligase [Thiohalophilus thiocyanatoxydans]TDY00470.1 UDP-N-acetylmuramate: L-alanyl-gamma-D-glutamyl-meso-diaminopimelate ligase [Thiohalophilus thiocyanatoxydans]